MRGHRVEATFHGLKCVAGHLSDLSLENHRNQLHPIAKLRLLGYQGYPRLSFCRGPNPHQIPSVAPLWGQPPGHEKLPQSPQSPVASNRVRILRSKSRCIDSASDIFGLVVSPLPFRQAAMRWRAAQNSWINQSSWTIIWIWHNHHNMHDWLYRGYLSISPTDKQSISNQGYTNRLKILNSLEGVSCSIEFACRKYTKAEACCWWPVSSKYLSTEELQRK